MTSHQDQTDGAVKERVETEKKEPTLYKVVLLNDDYTTMEFVIRVLESVFQKSPSEKFVSGKRSIFLQPLNTRLAASRYVDMYFSFFIVQV